MTTTTARKSAKVTAAMITAPASPRLIHLAASWLCAAFVWAAGLGVLTFLVTLPLSDELLRAAAVLTLFAPPALAVMVGVSLHHRTDPASSGPFAWMAAGVPGVLIPAGALSVLSDIEGFAFVATIFVLVAIATSLMTGQARQSPLGASA